MSGDKGSLIAANGSVNIALKKDSSSFNLRCDYSKALTLCERSEPRSHFISRLSMIVRVNVILNRTVVVDSD